MKKLFLALLTACTLVGSAAAASGKDRSVTLEQLPQKSQQFIKQYFADAKISYAKQDTDWLDGDYEVLFTDGRKAEFRKNGTWKEISCARSEVPAGIVPAAIKTFVNQKHPSDKITKIESDSRGYEIKLNSGAELKFNSKLQFMRYDN